MADPATTSQYQELIEVICESRGEAKLSLHSRGMADQFCREILAFLFPQFAEEAPCVESTVAAELERVRAILIQALAPFSDRAEGIADGFFVQARSIYQELLLDAKAIYSHDPAADSIDEVILAYPGFTAIALHRIAHFFHSAGLPIFPRLLAEYAHRETGIDIHPGAVIGKSFAIDHGTGIVIGETAVIGDRVILYQGVTLGATTVAKELARQKRHPTLGDDVIVYANATILGGSTRVGAGSVIGGNVFLTRSVQPNSIVSHTGKTETRRIAGEEPFDFTI